MSTISYPLSDESGEVFMFVSRAANIVLLQRQFLYYSSPANLPSELLL